MQLAMWPSQEHSSPSKAEAGGEAPCELVGEEVQRLSVVQNLPQLLEGNEQLCMQRVVPKVQQALPNASTEFHMAASTTFKTILVKKLVHPRTFTQTFLQSILSSIDSRDPVVANAWLETLLDVIDLLPADVVKVDILPVAVMKGQISQKLGTRITACKLLGKISTRVDHQTLKKDTLPIILSLCQDVKADVRACICGQLPFVAQGLGAEGLKPSILPLLVELASDEDAVVRLAAVEAIVCMLPYLQQDTLKNIIVPLVKKMCDASIRSEDLVMVVLAQVFGELCLGLDPSLSPQERRWFVGYYQQLAELGLRLSDRDLSTMPDLVPRTNNTDRFVECRHHCAFHFPAMTRFCTGSSDFFEELLYPVFCSLTCDPYFEVRRTIACGLHEVARVLGNCNGMIKSELVKLLRDDSEEVLTGLIPNLSKTLTLLTKSGTVNPGYMDTMLLEIGRALLKCELEVGATNNWRLHELLIRQFECLHLVLPSEFIHSYFTPMLFTNIHQGRQVPVRMAATNTLLVFLRYNTKNVQRNDIRSRIISELCNGHSCYSRMSFMRLCNQAMEIFSRKYFKENFYLSVLERAEDRIANIRLMFVKMLPRMKLCLRMPSDKKYFAALEASIRKIVSTEKDREVVNVMDTILPVLDNMDLLLDSIATSQLSKDDQEDLRRLEEETRLATVTGRHGDSKGNPSSAQSTSQIGAMRPTVTSLGKQQQQQRYSLAPPSNLSAAKKSNTATSQSSTARFESSQLLANNRTGLSGTSVQRVNQQRLTGNERASSARSSISPNQTFPSTGMLKDKDAMKSFPHHIGGTGMLNKTNTLTTCTCSKPTTGCLKCLKVSESAGAGDCNKGYAGPAAVADELHKRAFHVLKRGPLSPAEACRKPDGAPPGMVAGDYLHFLAHENPVLFPSILNRCFFESSDLALGDAYGRQRALDDKYNVRDTNIGKTNIGGFGVDGYGLHGGGRVGTNNEEYSLHGYGFGHGAKKFMVSSLEDEFYRDAGIKIPQQFASSLPTRIPSARDSFFKSQHPTSYFGHSAEVRKKQEMCENDFKKDLEDSELKGSRNASHVEGSTTYPKTTGQSGSAGTQKALNTKLVAPKKNFAVVSSQPESDKSSSPNSKASSKGSSLIVNRRHSYLAGEKMSKTNIRIEESSGPQKRTTVIDNSRRHSYIERLQISTMESEPKNDPPKRTSLHGREEQNHRSQVTKQAIPLRKSANRAAQNADPKQDAANRRRSMNYTQSDRTAQRGSEFVDGAVKRRSLIVPSPTSKFGPSRRHSSLERNETEKGDGPPYAGGRASYGGPGYARRSQSPHTSREDLQAARPERQAFSSDENLYKTKLRRPGFRKGSGDDDFAIEIEFVSPLSQSRGRGSKIPRSNNSSPGNSRSSSPSGAAARARHLTAPNSRAGSPTSGNKRLSLGTLNSYMTNMKLGDSSSKLPVRKK